MKSNQFFCAVCAVTMTLFTAPNASADIIFTFAESATGGVDVVGTGSGVVANSSTGSVTSSDWDVQDFGTDFLVDTFTASQTSSDSVSGTFANVTTGQSATLLNFDVDRDPTTADDLDYDTSTALTFSDGDEFNYSLTASFAATTLAFSDLILGTHIDVGRTQGAGIGEEVFGITTVNVVNAVPEPAMPTALLLLSAFGISRRCRR